GARVLSGQRVASGRVVVEARQLEALGVVAGLAGLLRLAQPKLAEVDVFVAALALARRVLITHAGAGAPVGLGRRVAVLAARLLVGPEQRPGIVRDLQEVPGGHLVAAAATARAHLLGELVAVGVVMAVRARLPLDLPAQPWGLARVARRARRRFVPARERE